MSSDVVVERLYRCLVAAVREQRPDPGESPLTVAEIYQDLVPYRAVRDELGVGLNADYEHAVLRLLAGVGDFARVEPPEVGEELRGELDAPNPNVALFRDFAACDVWIRLPEGESLSPDGDRGVPRDDTGDAASTATPIAPAATGDAAPSGSNGRAAAAPREGGAPRSEPPASDAVAPTADATPPSEPPPESRAAASSAPSSSSATDAIEDGGSCAFCGEALPAGRPVRYCPFCGADRRKWPCSACGDVLEPGWRYCAACGAAVRTAAGDDD